MSIYRATTPTLTFYFPFDVTTIDDLRLSFSQNKRTVLVLEKKDVEIDGGNIAVICTLKQEQTALFVPNIDVEIQFRVKVGTSVIASKILKVDAERVLETEAL